MTLLVLALDPWELRDTLAQVQTTAYLLVELESGTEAFTPPGRGIIPQLTCVTLGEQRHLSVPQSPPQYSSWARAIIIAIFIIIVIL